MTRLPAIAGLLAVLGLIGSVIAPTAAHAAPLGVPVPAHVTPHEVLGTTSENGDGNGVVPGTGACDSAPLAAVALPKDDGPHDTYIEWWWWYGNFSVPDGRTFAYMVFFGSKPWAKTSYTDITLTDLSTGTFHYDRQPLIVGNPMSMNPGVSLRAGHAIASAADGHDNLRFEIDGYDVELTLDATRPAVVELGDGHTTLYCNSLYNYSRSRMRTVGWLRDAGRLLPVHGSSHFVHNWGFAPGFEIARYDHFTFSLADGRDVYAVRLRAGRSERNDATFVLGSVTDEHGHVTQLHRGDFTMTATRSWRRDATCRYPIEWDLRVLDERFHIRPSVVNSELRSLRSPAMFALWPEWPAYWTGATQVSGSGTGQGWMEHAGYCAA